MKLQWPVVLVQVAFVPGLMAQAHDHQAMSGPLSPKAAAQVAEARQVASAFDTPAKAAAAGYVARFGDVPLQGEHWIKRDLVLNATFDLAHPPVLMFSRMNGMAKLVGVAYAYQVTQAAPTPEGFDGDADEWHEHPLLSLPGRRLTMTHVWFVDSPNGVFAHDNPTLPFLSRGLPLPPTGWLDPQAFTSLARSLGLAEAPAGPRMRLEQLAGDSVHRALEVHRGTIAAEVAVLDRAVRANDVAAYRAAATRAIAAGAGILATWRAAPKNPLMQQLMGKAMQELLGGEISVAP
ncbi:MAG: hypothetical protein V4558_04270 [Gemmatimonadota bacterium]